MYSYNTKTKKQKIQTYISGMIAFLCFFSMSGYASLQNYPAQECNRQCSEGVREITNQCPSFNSNNDFLDQCNSDVCNVTFINSLNELVRSSGHAITAENRIREKITTYLETIVDKCQEQKAQEVCGSICKAYAEDTSHGCPAQVGNFASSCDNMCSDKDTAAYMSGNNMSDSMLANVNVLRFSEIEKKWTDVRSQCIGEAKTTFVNNYAEQCGKKIKKIAESQGKTILCDEEATKENPQCQEYCQTEANTVYSMDDLSSHQFIVNMHERLSVNDENKKRIYYSLVAKDMGHFVQNEVEKLEIIDSDKQLVSPLSWWMCEKGKGQACESNLYRALEQAEKVCSDVQKEARECCYQPEKCVGGGLAATLDSLGKLHVAVAGTKGQKRTCEAVQQASGLYASMQGAMAAQCINKSNACSKDCNGEVEKVVDVFKESCNHDPRSKRGYNESEHSCDKPLFDHYMKMYRGHMSVEQIRIGEVSKECETIGRESNRRIQDMSTHLGSSLLAGMKECGQKPKEFKPTPNPPGYTPPPVATCPPNCPASPPAPPSVKPPGGGGGGGPSKVVADPFADDPLPQAANPFGEDPDLGESGPDMGKGPSKGMGGLLGGGGGTGGGGLGGLGGGGSPGGPARGGKDPAKKNKVLLGFKGGKFTGYGGGSSSGEERSRRRASRSGKKKRGMASLDLKKLLPKGKQLNNKVGKFGSPHDNIFQRMSDRIQWMCRTEQISCK